MWAVGAGPLLEEEAWAHFPAFQSWQQGLNGYPGNKLFFNTKRGAVLVLNYLK